MPVTESSPVPRREDSPTPPEGAWAAADRAIRALDVGPAVVELLVEVSLSEGESAWTKPALASFFRDEGDTATAERFFAELKELTLAARSIAVERRYAPWARTNAISDLPATTVDAQEAPPTPSVWLARWMGVAQRLSPTWEKVHPFLLELADEAPVIADEEETAERRDGLGGVSAFVGMLESLIEPSPAGVVVPREPAPPWTDAHATWLRDHVASVPRGPVEWAMRGRHIEFPDGSRFAFLRYPRLGEVELPPRLNATIALDEGVDGLARPWAAILGAYLSESASTLDEVASEFAARCTRSLGRLRERFSAELVQRSLASSGPSRGG